MAEQPIIDALVHVRWAAQEEIMEYMGKGWQAFIGKPGLLPGGRGMMPILPSYPYQHPDGDDREDAMTAKGPAGADLSVLQAQVLSRPGLQRAVLSHTGGALWSPALVNPYLAQEIARAANRWLIERWLQADARLYGLVLAANQTPSEAAVEIRRAGQHPRMVGVLLGGNGIGKPFGHPLYHPIYEAAAEMGLPIVVHAGGDAVPDAPTLTAGGGLPATYSEYHMLLSHPFQTHLLSLVTQGVFEKYPDLRCLFVGAGAAWITSLLWKFDTEYKTLRRESPWLRRLPSEVFRAQVRLGSFPLERPAEPERLARLLSTIDGMEDVLCFASGYPGRDADSVDEVRDLLPAAWLPKVLHDNAHALFRFDPRPQSFASGAAGVGRMEE